MKSLRASAANALAWVQLLWPLVQQTIADLRKPPRFKAPPRRDNQRKIRERRRTGTAR